MFSFLNIWNLNIILLWRIKAIKLLGLDHQHISFQQQSQKFTIFLSLLQFYSFPFLTIFLVICSEMLFKPLFAFAKHSVNRLLSWKFTMHFRNLICIHLWFLRLCWHWIRQWREAFLCSRWRPRGWANHWTYFLRVLSVYTPFFAVFQSAVGSHIVH